LLGEGCEIQIWDDNVSLGRLIGSNRQYIEDVIPHIGSLLSASLEDVLNFAEVVVVGTRGISRDILNSLIRPSHFVVDLVNLEKSHRTTASTSYEGICW
jgi:GDP-mannose 6-dehydrogenase